MDNIRSIITGGIITLFIGGAAFTFSQQDVIDNFSAETGLTQEQAEQYINNIPENELASWTEIGSEYVSTSKHTLELADSTDCINYEYEWESVVLTCSEGKAQMKKIANSERLLGQAYIKLDSDTATEADIHAVIRYIDQLNSDYDLEISVFAFDDQVIDEIKTTNLYNKSVLKAALESI